MNVWWFDWQQQIDHGVIMAAEGKGEFWLCRLWYFVGFRVLNISKNRIMEKTNHEWKFFENPKSFRKIGFRINTSLPALSAQKVSSWLQHDCMMRKKTREDPYCSTCTIHLEQAGRKRTHVFLKKTRGVVLINLFFSFIFSSALSVIVFSNNTIVVFER